MKVLVNRDACISCGACEAIASNIFRLDDEGISCIIKEDIKEEEKDSVRDASESCPTGAIEIEEK